MSEDATIDGGGGTLPPPPATATGGFDAADHPHHAIHRRFRWTMASVAIALMPLLLSWVFSRGVACWKEQTDRSFELWMCPNAGAAFFLFFAAAMAGVTSVHTPVYFHGRAHPDPAAKRPPGLGGHLHHYRRGLSLLNRPARETVRFSRWFLAALAAASLVAVFGSPRLLP